MPELRDWCVCCDNSTVDAHFHLTGQVYNDERFDNGDIITTSRVMSIQDNTATTKSGTVYTLGNPKMKSFESVCYVIRGATQ